MLSFSKNLLLLSLGIVLAAALLLVPLPGHWRGIWQSKIFDLGHVPLFAALTWLLWRLSSGRDLAVAVIGSVGLAGVAELLQSWVGRSGSWLDFARGVCGAGAAAASIAAWQRRSSLTQFAGAVLLASLSLAWPLYDAVPYLVDAYEGAQAFPTLADFSSPRELLRWRWRQAELIRVQRAGAWTGRLDFFPGAEPYPYGALRPIVRDFTGYRWLCCAFAVDGEPLEMVVSIRSGSGDPDETTHYQETRRYPAGANVVRLELPALAPKANPRPLDLTDIWIIQFFLENPPTARTIHLQRVWLEK